MFRSVPSQGGGRGQPGGDRGDGKGRIPAEHLCDSPDEDVAEVR